MAINFPNPATLNQTYTVGTKTWVYNGYAWDLVLANTAPILSVASMAFTQANSGVTIAQSAFTQANSGVTIAQDAYNTANTKFSSSGGTISGSVTITTDLNVTGNVYLGGNVTTLSSNNLSITDPLIYLAENNPANIQDIGIVGSFTSNKYQHTGIVRDATDGVWKLFSNVSAEPTTTIDFFSDVIYDPLKVGSIITSNASFIALNNAPFTVISNTLVSNLNVDFLEGQHGAYYTGLSNTATLIAQSAFVQANSGVTIAQSAFAKANSETIGQSAFSQANSGVTIAQSAFAKANSETIGQSAFSQANSGVTIAQSAFSQANSGVTIAQSAFAKANSETIGQSAFSQANSGVTIAQSAFSQANSGVTIAQSAFAQANSGVTIAQSAFSQANSGVTIAQSAFVQANSGVTIAQSAFAKANSTPASLTAGKAIALAMVMGF